MNANTEMSEAAAAIGRAPNVDLQLGPHPAFALVGLLQLACRHPGLQGSCRALAETLGRKIQAELGQREPILGRLLERGWHPVFDERPDPEKS